MDTCGNSYIAMEVLNAHGRILFGGHVFPPIGRTSPWISVTSMGSEITHIQMVEYLLNFGPQLPVLSVQRTLRTLFGQSCSSQLEELERLDTDWCGFGSSHCRSVACKRV